MHCFEPKKLEKKFLKINSVYSSVDIIKSYFKLRIVSFEYNNSEVPTKTLSNFKIHFPSLL